MRKDLEEEDERELQEERQEREEEEPPRRRGFLVRIGSLLLMLILVLGSVALVIYHDELNLDSLRRTIAYHNVKTGANGAADAFSFENDKSSVFSSFDGGLLVASATGYQQFARDGTMMVSETVYLEKPVISAGETLAAVYDAGGSALRLISGKEVVLSLDLPEGESIFSAHVNGGGYLALTASVSGYKAAVSVYDDRQKPAFRWRSSSRYVVDAAVSEDCRYMAAATVGQENALFDGQVVIYRLDSEEELTHCSLGDVIPLEIRCLKDAIWVVCDEKAILLDDEGAVLGEYDYGGLNLAQYSIDGDDSLVLLLGGHAGAGYMNLVRVDSGFKKTAELPIQKEVFSLSAAGRYLALLFADRLEIYNADLEIYSTLEGTESAQEAIVREDGSVMLIGDGTARLYIP